MILDACCGSKMMYKGLHRNFSQDEIVFIDIRKGIYPLNKWHVPPVNIWPDIVADLKHLPFRDKTFSLILFDPPHGSFGVEAYFGAKYGGLKPNEYVTLLVWANIEFARVLTDDGYVFAKIHETQGRDIRCVRNFSNFKLLMDISYRSQAQKNTSVTKTHWLIFVKRSADKLSTAADNDTPKHPARRRLHRLSSQEPSALAAYLSEPSYP
jgi:hypothetical protein